MIHEQPTAYVNARLLDPDSGLDGPGALLAKDGVIADFGPDLFADGVPDGIATVDCGGHCLAPGLIDMHVHFREPGHEHKETIATGGLSAAAGGVTSVACMPNTKPVIDDVALIEFVQRRAREAKGVKVYPMGAVTKGLEGRQLTEMGMLAEAGAVGFTDDGLPVADSQVMRRALSYARTFDLIVSQHAEDLSLTSCGCMAEGEVSTRLGLPGIPDESEIVVVERDIRLVELTGGRYHVAHISTAGAVDAGASRQACGAACNVRSGSPPLRAHRARRGRLPHLRQDGAARSGARPTARRWSKGLKDGTIDAIASDHAPHDQESKRVPMERAANGIVGLETMLPLSLELYHGGHVSLREVLRRLTSAPADLLGIDAGRLRRGAPADLVLFDLEAPWRVDRSESSAASRATRPSTAARCRAVCCVRWSTGARSSSPADRS